MRSNCTFGGPRPKYFSSGSSLDATRRFQSSSLASHHPDEELDALENNQKIQYSLAQQEIQRLMHIRNVGILAHVDAGKTTVTERMLALAGVVQCAGAVDDGNTVTDYLPAERERGITIQSAAISFDWGWHNNKQYKKQKQEEVFEPNDKVRIQLIDTPGHVDFSVEVNRSVAVLDGAVLVVDAVAGVQAQTETVWRAMTRPSWNNHDPILQEQDEIIRGSSSTRPLSSIPQDHAHEPLPCLALINKMDKDGSNFGKAMQSLREKLPGANPIAIQIPLFRTDANMGRRREQQQNSSRQEQILQLPPNIIAVSPDDMHSVTGEFVGVVDLIHLRAILWPDHQQGGSVSNVENCIPTIVDLSSLKEEVEFSSSCKAVQEVIQKARFELMEALAEVDSVMEEYYLNEQEPTPVELRAALRRATLSHKAVPVMAGAALKGKGLEPLLDAVADYLPSPLDRMPPALHELKHQKDMPGTNNNNKRQQQKKETLSEAKKNVISLGHPLHPSVLALAFKVVHMKGRGGSGDGRVVFARVYSGKLKDRDTIRVISPPAPGTADQDDRNIMKPREERIGGMLELAGGRFDNVQDGVCRSGEVCALVGLKTVVTGDTILLASDQYHGGGGKSKKANASHHGHTVCLAGVASPKPVITVRLEAESSSEQTRLSEVLKLMAIEDPSLVVEETESSTLLSGLGELHIEVTLDRLYREHDLKVMVGPPSVAYRETVKEAIESPGGLLEYDRTIGGTRLQGEVQLLLKPIPCEKKSACVLLSDPIVTVGPKAREFLGLNPDFSEEELLQKSDLARALIRGCQGALRRGPLKSAPMANVLCHVEDVDAEGGLQALKALPGALQAASAFAVAKTLSENREHCTVLEPTMFIEVTLPNDMVGTVVSDLSGRRGTVEDVIVGENSRAKSLIRGDVPLVEILGYANSLRSITAGEGAFSAEYKGHSPC